MAIVINGSGTVTGLAVGGLPDGTVDAGTLATNSVDSAELVDGSVDDSHMASISGRRNMIINGAMQVAQRSSATGLTNGSGGTFGQVDRWRYNESGSPSSQFTLSQDTDSPNTFGNSLKMDCTTSGSGHNVVELEYRVEAQDLQGVGYGTSSAKQITLSFWVKSNQTGTGNVGLYRLDNTPRHAAGNYTISSADTWEYKTITYAADTSQAVDNNNDTGMKIWFTLGAASNYNTSTGDGTWGGYADGKRGGGMTLDLTSSTNDYIKITGLQMELGSTATDFEHRSYGEELELCKRYYHLYAQGTLGHISIGFFESNSQVSSIIKFIPEMRAQPSLEIVSGTNYYALNDWVMFDTFTLYGQTKRSTQIYRDSGVSGTKGNAGFILSNHANAKVAFSAEL